MHKIEYSLAWNLGTNYSATALIFQWICLVSTFGIFDAWFVYEITSCYNTISINHL